MNSCFSIVIGDIVVDRMFVFSCIEVLAQWVCY